MADRPPLPLFDTLAHHKSIPDRNEDSILFFDDYKYAHAFLYCYRGSEATYNTYRRDVERFLQWAWLVAGKSLKDIRRADIEAYIEFCLNPPRSWIGLQKVPRYIEHLGQRAPNPDWRPFVATVSKTAFRQGLQPDISDYRFSQSAVKDAFACLSSFFNYLVQEGYIEFNPVLQIRQKSKFLVKTAKPKIRRLTELQWAYVIETAEMMAEANPELHERALFIMNALYGMYLRISELATTKRWAPKMGDFYRDHDGNWWFKTIGKGNKERDVSVSNAMLKALKRYRKYLNLTALPSPGDTTPLLSKAHGKGPITSTRQISSIVQTCFDAAINRLLNDGFIEEAEQLQAATVHWLRHTGISDDVKRRPREHVRDDAGHSSGATTDKYIDITARERNASAKDKPIKLDNKKELNKREKANAE